MSTQPLLVSDGKSFTSKYTLVSLDDGSNVKTNNYITPIIPEVNIINDSRILSAFKTHTFGGYSKNNVITELDKMLIDEKIEASIYWAFQLFFSGTVSFLIDKMHIFAAKNINIANPLLPQYLWSRIQLWNKITDNKAYSRDNILNCRNHPELRNMLVELVTIITLSKKRKCDNMSKPKKEDFLLANFQSRLEGANVPSIITLIDDLFKTGDPSEIRTACIEFAYALFNSKMQKTLFWLSWIFEWETINIKRYGKFECGERFIDGIDIKYSKQIIWLIWNIINRIIDARISNDSINMNKVKEQVGYLYQLFTYKFKGGRKIHLLIWAISYINWAVDWNTKLIDKPAVLFQVLLNQEKMLARFKSQCILSRGAKIGLSIEKIAVKDNYTVPDEYKIYEVARANALKSREDKLNSSNINNLITQNNINKTKQQSIQMIDIVSNQTHTNNKLSYLSHGLDSTNNSNINSNNYNNLQSNSNSNSNNSDNNIGAKHTVNINKKSNVSMSENSKKKMDIMNQIDKMLF